MSRSRIRTVCICAQPLLLIKTLSDFPAEVFIENRTASRGPVLARSLVDVTRLQIRQGDSVRFSISTPDPKPVIDSIQSLVESQFGESAQPAPSKRNQWRTRHLPAFWRFARDCDRSSSSAGHDRRFGSDIHGRVRTRYHARNRETSLGDRDSHGGIRRPY